ncbi:30S ribosomal protein S8 [Mycobacterium kansasii 662]|uniref:Small ribosomal subunit protein uS8 n=1 Tax=Mycobacterium kansasii 662 TaxID=1299326 RepID=X7YWS2_MYCKA|nr:30S ribosomal protein S8 [Mycobacterium kansasii 662]
MPIRRTTTRCGCRIPRSKANIAQILKNEGYISDFRTEDARVGKSLIVQLKYGPSRERSIAGFAPGVQAGVTGIREIHQSAAGTRRPGVAIISTSSGLLTDRQGSQTGRGRRSPRICLVRVW